MAFRSVAALWFLPLSLLALSGCEPARNTEVVPDAGSAKTTSPFHTTEDFDPEPPLDLGWLSQPIGRWVIYRAERPDQKDSCDREKYVLESIRDNVAHVRSYCLGDDDDETRHLSDIRYAVSRRSIDQKNCRLSGCYPSERSEGRVKDDREDLVIEGEMFACTVTTYEWSRYDAEDEVKGRHEVTLWQTDQLQLPPRALENTGIALPTNTIKARYVVEGKDRASGKIDSRVTSLTKTKRIDGKDLHCVEETSSSEARRDGKQRRWKSVSLSSNDVPGSWIESHEELRIGDEPVQISKLRLESFGYENPEDETRAIPVTILVRLRGDVDGSPCVAKVEVEGKTATVRASDADDLRKKLSDAISSLKPKAGECVGDISAHPYLRYDFLKATLQAIAPHVTVSFPLADRASRQAVKKNNEIMARVSAGYYMKNDVIYVFLKTDKVDPLSELDLVIPPRVDLEINAEKELVVRLDSRYLGIGDTTFEQLEERTSKFFREFSSREEASKSGCELITHADVSAWEFVAAFRACSDVDDETNIARARRTKLPGINFEPDEIKEELLEEEFFAPTLDEKETKPMEK